MLGARGRRRRRVKVDKGLRFYHEILGLDHLQYGLWEGENLDLPGLRGAQERYAETLHGWIPEGVRTILDVGCGTGASAERLLAKGYEVEGVSPDPYQRQIVEGRTGMPFHLARLQEFQPQKTYDLAMFSESAQYVWLDAFFPNVLAVASGGYLLVADYFSIADGKLPERSGHPLEAFMAAAEDQGFELERREDVTERVLPTLELARGFIERYGLPSLKLLADLFQQDRPRLYGLLRWLAREKVEKELAKLEFMIDAEAFRESKRYLFLLFRVPEG